ncbi:MAG TPA: succinate--CoA ligase subunit alpha [Thermoplasmata archaeon]|jgi:succinyl-CoA synthetase alpha subunit|nr:succinate--CoA ligase subunit alpha [Thermoplasmata archaeon]
MSVLLDKSTKLIVQGITGHQGQFHTRAMLEYGTNVVAGVTPGKGGESVNGVPVYDACAEAVTATGANASIVFVPAPFAKDAAIEAIEAGVKLLVIITERIPFHDCLDVMPYARAKGVAVIGPNCPGVCTAGAAKVGIMPNHIFAAGPYGVVSRSGTLTYEIVDAMTKAGVGQTTCIGIGGDPVIGTSMVEALALFDRDPATEGVVLVGEIGGTAEEEAARYAATMKKPVFAYVAGQTAPPGKRMGHAGAIITAGMGTAESKRKAFADAGVSVAKYPREIPELIRSAR